MNRLIPIFGALLLSVPIAAQAADRTHPTVIELFQSQGCSSCPPANANLNAIAGRKDLLPLSFAITYWDYLGWKDTFDKPAFTKRQRDYAHAGNRSNVYTPQMIVNGRGVLVGTRKSKLQASIAKYDRGDGGPSISWSKGGVHVGTDSHRRSSIVWLVRYDPRTLNVSISRGENNGRTLPHRNIVKQLVRLGTWNGSAKNYTLRRSPSSVLKTALLVQQGRGGPIIAASKMN